MPKTFEGDNLFMGPVLVSAQIGGKTHWALTGLWPCLSNNVQEKIATA